MLWNRNLIVLDWLFSFLVRLRNNWARIHKKHLPRFSFLNNFISNWKRIKQGKNTTALSPHILAQFSLKSRRHELVYNGRLDSTIIFFTVFNITYITIYNCSTTLNKVSAFRSHTMDTAVGSDLHIHTYMSNCKMDYIYTWRLNQL